MSISKDDLIKRQEELQTNFDTMKDRIKSMDIELGNLKRKFVDENSPEIVFKKSEIEEIKLQIDFERNELVAPKGKDLTKKVQKLSELENNLK